MENKDEQNPTETVSGPGVLEKYQEAGKICKTTLAKVLERCVPGASINELCAFGDCLIEEAAAKCYTKKVKSEKEGDDKVIKMEKGIGFPTTISCNEICGHYSPCKSDDQTLKEGDMAKINVGCQIDGYVAQLGHTIVVGKQEVTGNAADVMMAAWTGLQAAIRLLKPGNTNTQITAAIKTSCDSFNCMPVEGVLSHEVQRFLIDGNNVIINKETYDAKVSETEFQVNQIFVLDVFASTGEGKPKESAFRCDVFKRDLDANTDLKSKNARSFFTEARKRYGGWPFALRSFEDELVARAGTQECINANIINQYPVVIEKAGEQVAQYQWTVLISGKRIILLTSHMLDESTVKSEGSVTDEKLAELLKIELSDLTSKKKVKK